MNEKPVSGPMYQQVAVSAVIEEVPGVKTFLLTPLQGELIYKAGQFITFTTFHNGVEMRRSYSFSSSPALHEPISITVKRINNGFFSRYLADVVKPGDVLDTIGIAGLYVLPADVHLFNQVYFIAAGVGITPIYSLIKTILNSHAHMHVTLVYSNSSADTTLFYKELKELERAYEKLHIIFLFSNNKDLLRARLSKSLLSQLVRSKAKTGYEQALFYICGPFAYMRMAIMALEELGIPGDHIKKENFDTTIPVIASVPPDMAPHQVKLTWNDKTYQFSSQYPDTILHAARKHGLDLPYSCNAGKCGTCLARCTAGTVWHAYNEVLTDQELTKGMVLTCTAYPAGGDVTITF